jgi:flagellar biogenesis protein FliO
MEQASQAMDYFRLLLVLGGVLILAYLTLRFWMPRAMGVRASSGGPLQVLARFPLEPRKILYVIKAGSSAYLVGTSETGMHYLTALDTADLESMLHQQEARPAAGSEFQRLLRSWRGGKD